MQNPYLEMLDIMGKATVIPSVFFIGKVKSKLPDLVVNLDGIELNSNDFLISSSLLTLNHADIKATNETVTHNLKDELNVNDKVLLIRVNDTFILLSKVVSI